MLKKKSASLKVELSVDLLAEPLGPKSDYRVSTVRSRLDDLLTTGLGESDLDFLKEGMLLRNPDATENLGIGLQIATERRWWLNAKSNSSTLALSYGTFPSENDLLNFRTEVLSAISYQTVDLFTGILRLTDKLNTKNVAIGFQRSGQRQWWLSTVGSPTNLAFSYGGSFPGTKVLEFGSGTQQIGFLGATPVGKRTSGANLTNNVTPGGTTDVIDNWTDLTIYANDASAIRNAVYQLARKVKQVNDGLRSLGLFT